MSEGYGDGLGELFEELEQQAEGLRLAERDAELADRARGEYAGVTMDSRVHGSLGLAIRLELHGGHGLAGTIADAGVDWLHLTEPPRRSWVVCLGALVVIEGLSLRATVEAARPVTARRSLGSAVRQLASESDEVRLLLTSGSVHSGRVLRVGADFVECRSTTSAGRGRDVVTPFATLAAVGREWTE